MHHERIIEWAEGLGLSTQHTTQGPPMGGWPVTMLTGPVVEPLRVAKAEFGRPDRKHIPVKNQVVYGFDDDRVVLVLVDGNGDGEVDSWMHVFLYADDALYELGWGSQSGG